MKPLSVKGLNLFYGAHHALKDVSLNVAAGSFVALLGPSGCGKTSLLRSIAGFTTPHTGQIMVGDTDVTRVPPRRRNMGVVFQSYALFPHMTALENVCFGLESRGVGRAAARARAIDALAMVDLTDHAPRRPRELSGGQQQRVALARALAIEPDILLLDEPLGALDRKLRLQLQGELRKLQTRLGVTALLVTHDQEEALALADQVAVMRNGVIEQLDSPARLFRAPQTAWVADFIGAGSLLAGGGSSGPVDERGAALRRAAATAEAPVSRGRQAASGTRGRDVTAGGDGALSRPRLRDRSGCQRRAAAGARG